MTDDRINELKDTFRDTVNLRKSFLRREEKAYHCLMEFEDATQLKQ